MSNFWFFLSYFIFILFCFLGIPISNYIDAKSQKIRDNSDLSDIIFFLEQISHIDDFDDKEREWNLKMNTFIHHSKALLRRFQHE